MLWTTAALPAKPFRCARISCLEFFQNVRWTNPGGLEFMRKSWVLCVLAGALAWGQATPGGPPQSSPAPGAGAAQAGEAEQDSSASVPPTAAVITIDGVCDTQLKTTAASQGTAAKGATPSKPAAADC